VRRALEYGAVVLRTVAVHEIDGRVTLEGLRRRPSFHPMSSAVFLLLALGLLMAGAIVAGYAGWPAYDGRVENHVALAAFKVALIPVVAAVTHELQLGLRRLYRVGALRQPIEWIFAVQCFWVREPSDDQLALGCVAAEEIARRSA